MLCRGFCPSRVVFFNGEVEKWNSSHFIGEVCGDGFRASARIWSSESKGSLRTGARGKLVSGVATERNWPHPARKAKLVTIESMVAAVGLEPTTYGL